MRNVLFVLLAIFAVSSCQNRYNESKYQQQRENINKELVNVNRQLISKDSLKILGYARMHNWDMNVTGTGLWYQIVEHGRGVKVKEQDIVTLDYNVKLLNGTICYSSDSTGNKVFKVSKGGVERGLEEGVLLMHQGDSVRFIMPPYLAYHLMGDLKKIPPRSIIIYEVRLKSVKN